MFTNRDGQFILPDGFTPECKMVAIKELPDGYWKELLMKIAINENVTVAVVAKPGRIGDWACYMGFPAIDEILPILRVKEDYQYYCTCVRYPEDVMANGDKLDEKTAVFLFPHWEARHYRS